MSDELLARDAQHVWHPYTQHGFESTPLPVVSAHGATLVLEDGRELIDGISSWWTCLHGHGHPRLVTAAARQARELDHVLFAGATHEPAVRLAEELVEATPAGLTRVFYSDNGSTAVEVALKMVVHSWVLAGVPERCVFVALEGSYHGDTVGAMSIGDPDPFFEPYGPLLFEVRRVPASGPALESALGELGGRAAGVVIEPLVQGAAGMRMHPAEFVRAARAACDAHGLPLIADEVMTGFGRTGALFACERASVAPDLLCLAKGLTSGMLPLAVTLTTERMFAAFLSSERAGFFAHGHSMTANPIGCAVALESMALCREEGTPARLEAIGNRIQHGIVELCDSEHVRDLRRTGGIVAVELRPPPGDRTDYLSSLAPRLRAAAVERGVLLRPLGNVLYALPPACTSDEQCDQIARTMVALVHDLPSA